MKAFAYDVYHFFPPNYFKYSQASVIRIEYPYEVYPEIIAIRAEVDSMTAMQTALVSNNFNDNLNIQVITYSERKYKAGVLEFDCQMSLVRLSIQGNSITRT